MVLYLCQMSVLYKAIPTAWWKVWSGNELACYSDTHFSWFYWRVEKNLVGNGGSWVKVKRWNRIFSKFMDMTLNLPIKLWEESQFIYHFWVFVWHLLLLSAFSSTWVRWFDHIHRRRWKRNTQRRRRQQSCHSLKSTWLKIPRAFLWEIR